MTEIINPIGFPPGAFPPGAFPLLPIFPVSLDEVKEQLRIYFDNEDFLLISLILAATNWAEMFQRRFYIARMNIEYLDDFPNVIRPIFSPLIEVDSIKYLDTIGSLQLLDSLYYRADIDIEPGIIEPAYSYNWPDIYPVTNAVIVTYKAGYGEADDVPDDIKAAIKMLVQYWYERGRNPSLIEQAKKVLWKKRLVTV